jgi:hypothetical protein
MLMIENKLTVKAPNLREQFLEKLKLMIENKGRPLGEDEILEGLRLAINYESRFKLRSILIPYCGEGQTFISINGTTFGLMESGSVTENTKK